MTEMNQTDSYPEGTSGLESKEQDMNSQTTGRLGWRTQVKSHLGYQGSCLERAACEW